MYADNIKRILWHCHWNWGRYAEDALNVNFKREVLMTQLVGCWGRSSKKSDVGWVGAKKGKAREKVRGLEKKRAGEAEWVGGKSLCRKKWEGGRSSTGGERRLGEKGKACVERNEEEEGEEEGLCGGEGGAGSRSNYPTLVGPGRSSGRQLAPPWACSCTQQPSTLVSLF